jgi:hypothetical protein
MGESRERFVDIVKEEALSRHHTSSDPKEILRLKCSILKPFYQIKGSLVLTHDEILFVYVDEQAKDQKKTDIKDLDSLFFFKRQFGGDKVFKLIDLEDIRDLQRRKFVGFKTCLELFFTDHSSMLVQFLSGEQRDSLAKKLVKLRGFKCRNLKFYDSLDPKKIVKRRDLTERWRQWKMSNF